MTGINNVQQIVATLRTQIAKYNDNHRLGSAARHHRTDLTNTTVQPRELGSLISRRVKALDPLDQDRRRKTFRIFLESVFLDEFGENLINDHLFYQMIDTVQRTMEQDPQIQSMIDTAVTALIDDGVQQGKTR